MDVELKVFDMGYGTDVMVALENVANPVEAPFVASVAVRFKGRINDDVVFEDVGDDMIVDEVGVEEEVGVGDVVEINGVVEKDAVAAVLDGPSPGMLSGKHADGSGVDAEYNCVPQDAVSCSTSAVRSKSTAMPISFSAVMPVFEAPAL